MPQQHQQQRKYRTREERDALCRDVVTEAVRLGLALDSAPFLALLEAFGKFTERDHTHGGTVQGTIPADEVRPGADIEYVLPARRVLRPMVRLVTRPAANERMNE